MKETDLYLPVKSYLEQKGFLVKSEVADCDIVALKNEGRAVEESLIVELKLSFSLELVHQGIERQRLLDNVYLAVAKPDSKIKHRNWQAKLKANVKLCRLLGLGLMTVDCHSSTMNPIDVIIDPSPYSPKKSKFKHQRLLKEFNQRIGDPNQGGVSKRKIITAYRQSALIIAFQLSHRDVTSLKVLRAACGIDKCAAILQKNHYGWFERVARGEYRLTQFGKDAIIESSEYITELMNHLPVNEESINGSAS